MAKINHYLTMVLFTVMFLIGLQIPSVIDQYTKRVDAQLIEATSLLKQYQIIANKYHNGDMQDLIELHKQSQNPSFKDEATVIQTLVDRYSYLKKHKVLLDKNIFSAGFVLIFQADTDIYNRTIDQYTMSVQFTLVALAFGAIFAVICCALYEFIQFVCKYGYFKIKQKRRIKKTIHR
ncbi:DUF2937 family protein [Marinicellulosiphila megalodicopiae]|uniref:DUF2937 family protein n=1 Tax=Marinicellulosiphila megalodicopiae TaxID=2724896 RepID=UPI003BB1A064